MQEPGEWYEYRLRHSSDTLSFRASPRPGPENQVSFVVYGDMGESDHARAKAPGYTFIMLHFCLVGPDRIPGSRTKVTMVCSAGVSSSEEKTSGPLRVSVNHSRAEKSASDLWSGSESAVKFE